ncbi:cell division protein ZipA [Salinicola aestuarinus]|uniref:cell division protein ZipA n=1 Tax=Salinicola aestuarinus TaxID=1949082 RepID=UPI000DA1FB6D|nr:cell division protein ZipA [Salinicola aestuarinus]
MELREWLIILGLVLVATIVIDGFRRLQRQRRVPRLDRATTDAAEAEGDAVDSDAQDTEEQAREAEMNWELPNGGARVVRAATFERSQDAMEPVRPTEPKRQERIPEASLQSSILDRRSRSSFANMQANVKSAMRAGAKRMSESAQRLGQKRDDIEHDDEAIHEEPRLAGFEADVEPDTRAADAERLRIETLTPVDLDPDQIGDEQPARSAADTRGDTGVRSESLEAPAADDAPARRDDVVTPHPVVERAKRHHVNAARARETLADAEEIIVISVLARSEEGFDGTTLLKLMLACGLRFSEMGIFHRFETEESDSQLQFSMVNVLKPGVFDLDKMDEIVTPGVSFLMPLPGANDTSVAFEAMLETAMVLVRHLGGELKDENHSVMTAQTIEFARQRVQDFERRHRLHRYQAN